MWELRIGANASCITRRGHHIKTKLAHTNEQVALWYFDTSMYQICDPKYVEFLGGHAILTKATYDRAQKLPEGMVFLEQLATLTYT